MCVCGKCFLTGGKTLMSGNDKKNDFNTYTFRNIILIIASGAI